MHGSNSPTQPLQLSAVAELVLAAGLWGFGFVATYWALEDFGPLSISALRCTIAVVVGFAICFAFPRLRSQLNRRQMGLAFWPGVFMTLTLILQTWGLRYTTATKSGFITTLYVLIVPILERLILSRRIPKYHFAFVFLALIGMALICDIPQLISGTVSSGSSAREIWNFGDWLTLACAFAAALQIFWFGKIQNEIKSSFIFNLYQTFWAGLIPLALMFFFEAWPKEIHSLPIAGMISLTFGSTLVAFALQVRAQKKISPSIASLIFLLESPFAALFGLWFLGERLTPQIVLGAVIILISLITSVVVASRTSAPEQAPAKT